MLQQWLPAGPGVSKRKSPGKGGSEPTPLRLIKINPVQENEFQEIHRRSLRFSAFCAPDPPLSDLGPRPPHPRQGPARSVAFHLLPATPFSTLHAHTLEFSPLFLSSCCYKPIEGRSRYQQPTADPDSLAPDAMGVKYRQPGQSPRSGDGPQTPLARPRQPHPAGPRGTVTPTRMDARPGSLRRPQSMRVCGEHVETPSYKPALNGAVRLCPATAPEEACQALAGGERGLEPGGRTVCRGSGRACEGSQVLLAVPPPRPPQSPAGWEGGEPGR